MTNTTSTPLGYLPYYEDLHILAEIEIRGRFTMMACDIELSLINIAAFCIPDPENQLRKFKGLMMHNKIEIVICDLKRYKKDYYIKYQEELEKLWEFKDIRNDVCHHTLHFDNINDLSKFKFCFIGENEQIKCREYTLEYFNDSIKRFRKLNVVLAELVEELRGIFNNSSTTP